MERRTFLWLTATGLLAPLLSCNSELAVPTALAHPLSLSAINDAATLKQLGERYRTLTPDEAGRQALVRLLLTDENGQIVSQIDSSDLQQFLLQSIRQDYRSTNTVMLDGWILSVTEARQCALFSLTS